MARSRVAPLAPVRGCRCRRGNPIGGCCLVRVGITNPQTLPLPLLRPGAPLAGACGHVLGDATLLARGYRPFAASGDLPAFLIRRMLLADERCISLTVLGGIDPLTHESALASATADEIPAVLREQPAELFRLLLTIGNATVSWLELVTALERTDPLAYAAAVRELSELPLVARRSCPVCRQSARA